MRSSDREWLCNAVLLEPYRNPLVDDLGPWYAGVQCPPDALQTSHKAIPGPSIPRLVASAGQEFEDLPKTVHSQGFGGLSEIQPDAQEMDLGASRSSGSLEALMVLNRWQPGNDYNSSGVVAIL